MTIQHLKLSNLLISKEEEEEEEEIEKKKNTNPNLENMYPNKDFKVSYTF